MAAETELERMVVRLIGDAQQYQQALKDATAATKEEAGKMEGVLKQLGQTALQVGGALAMSSFLKSSFGEWTTAEHTAIALEASLRANGRAVEPLLEDYKAFAAELQKVTRIGDDTTLAIVKAAEGFDLTGDSAKKATRDAIALAAVTGGSAESMLRLTAAMAKGDTDTAMLFARMVPQLRGVRNEQEFLTRFQKLVQAGWEAETKAASTASGQLDQLKNDYGDLQEDLGKVVAEGLLPVVQGAKEVVHWFQGLSDGTKQAIVVTTALGASTLGVITAYSTLKTLGVVGTISTIVTSTRAWTAANVTLAGSLKGVGVAAAAVAAVGATTWIVQNTERAKTFNAELEKMARQSEFAKQQLAGRADAAIAVANKAGSREERVGLLQKEAEKAKAIVAMHKESADEAKAHYDELDASIQGPLTRALNPQLGAAETNLKQQQEQLAAAEAAARKVEAALQDALNPKIDPKVKRAVEETTAKLQEQVQVFGLTEAATAVYKLQLMGATDAQLANARGLQQMLDALAEDKRAKEEAAEAAKKMADEAANMANEMEASIATFGLSADAAKIFKMEMEGLDEATAGHLRGLVEQKDALEQNKKLMEDGARVTEQILGKDPLAKYAATMEHLNELKAAGAIEEQVYAMGVKQAADEMNKAGKEADKVKQKFDAALSNSADARQRIQQFYDALDRDAKQRKPADQKFDAVQRGGAEANQRQQKQVEKLGNIERILQKQADKPVLMVEPANF